MCNCGPSLDPSTTLARALMCHGCMARRGNVCGKSKTFTSIHIEGDPCPLTKFPDSIGITFWAGLEWIGVPKPLRWWARLTVGKFDQSKLGGCGCIKALREWFGRVILRSHKGATL